MDILTKLLTGKFRNEDGEYFLTNAGIVPMCNYAGIREDNEWKYRCERITEYISKEEFYTRCLDCQVHISRMLENWKV